MMAVVARLEALEAWRAKAELTQPQPQTQLPTTQPWSAGPTPALRPGGPGVGHLTSAHTVIGNLGWNMGSEDCVAMGKSVLQQANIPDGAWSHMSSTRDPGSMVQLFFENTDWIGKAKTAIRDLKLQCPNAKRNCWCDRKKNDKELAPAKCVHRITDFLQHTEANREAGSASIEKCLIKKTVSRAGELIGQIWFGKWKWSPAALHHYDQNTLNHAEAWGWDS